MTEVPQPNERLPVSTGTVILFLIAIGLGVMAFFAVPTRITPEGQTAAAPAADPFAGISLEAKAAIVIDIESGKTLYEKNSDAQLPLASLTKVALALVVAEALPLDSVITIPYYAGGSEGTEHLSKGERWRVRDIVDFMLVASSNGSAEILADTAEKTVHERYPESPEGAATLWRMNGLARELKLEHTYFLNVSGLDLSATQAGSYGSARDMASLFAYAASAQASLFAGTARGGLLLSGPSGNNTTALNTNDAQGAIPGLILGKTGLTDLAGGNLGVVFDAGLARPVVAIVLGSTEHGRFKDMQKLVTGARKTAAETE